MYRRKLMMLCTAFVCSVALLIACGEYPSESGQTGNESSNELENGTANGNQNATNSDENGLYPYGHYEDDEMIGVVRQVDADEKEVEVDISEWEKRDIRGPGIDDIGYSYHAEITAETVIQYEDGTPADLSDLQTEQKVRVDPSRGDEFRGVAESITLLDMDYEEKYWRILSHRDDTLNIVVIYEDGAAIPDGYMLEQIIHNIDQQTVGSAFEYDPDYVVDFKDALDIARFPVIFVSSDEEILFQAYDPEDVYDFFAEME